MTTHYWLLTHLFLFWCLTHAGIAAATSYVVVSMIGSQLTIVTGQQQTHLDRNFNEVRPLSDPVLDATALTAAKVAIEKVRPGASVATLRLNDPKLLALQGQWFETDKIDAPELLDLLKGEIGDDPATRLVIIASYRVEPQLRTTKASLGTGKVAGLGFYMDRSTPLYRSDTGQQGRGFLGPFANFRVALVDPRSRAIERQQLTAAGWTFAAAQAEDRDPWNALSDKEKIRALQTLLAEEIARMIPLMLDQGRQ